MLASFSKSKIGNQHLELVTVDVTVPILFFVCNIQLNFSKNDFILKFLVLFMIHLNRLKEF